MQFLVSTIEMSVHGVRSDRKEVRLRRSAGHATQLSAGGVADEWVTQSLRQGGAKVFKKYSQMKLQMKREALVKLNRMANEQNVSEDLSYGTARVN